MSDEAYKQFLPCRQTKLFTKGIQLEHFNLNRKGELNNRKMVDLLGYVLRTVLQNITLQALRNLQGDQLKVLAFNT